MAGFSSIIEGCRNIYCDSPLSFCFMCCLASCVVLLHALPRFMRCRASCVVILLTLSYFLLFHTSCAATLTALLHAPFYDLAAFYDSLLLSPGL